jgi:energy-converting hydrogenase B subunit K
MLTVLSNIVYLTSSDCIGCGKCLRKCPTGAIRKTEDGYYLTCINCGECARICPSNAIKRNKRGGYYVDKSKCTRCGLCAATCPTNSITMEEGYPRGICLQCGLCAKVCPVGARIKVESDNPMADMLSRAEGDKANSRQPIEAGT